MAYGHLPAAPERIHLKRPRRADMLKRPRHLTFALPEAVTLFAQALPFAFTWQAADRLYNACSCLIFNGYSRLTFYP